MTDVLKNLPITAWYKAVAVVSAAALLITLAARRDELAMIFGGAFLIGIGEWKNHPKKQVEFRPAPGGVAKVTDLPRKTTWFGALLQLAGLALMVYGAYRALGLSLPF